MKTSIILFSIIIFTCISCKNPSSNHEEPPNTVLKTKGLMARALSESTSIDLYGQQYIPRFDFLLNRDSVRLFHNGLNSQKIIELINRNRLKDQEYFVVKNRKVKVNVTSDASNLHVFINGFPLDRKGPSNKRFEKEVPVFPDSVAILIFGEPAPDVKELKAQITMEDVKYSKDLVHKASDKAPKELTMKKKISFSDFKIKELEYDKRLQKEQSTPVISDEKRE